MRTSTPGGQPEVDIPGLGDDDCANNDFEFQGDSPPITTGNIQSPFDCLDETFPTSPGDKEGAICPFSAHIRKSYPRDDTDPAVPPLREVTTQTHRLLRRGIPFGPVSPSTPMSPIQDGIDRGLVFLAYQTSIEDQFEFVGRFPFDLASTRDISYTHVLWSMTPEGSQIRTQAWKPAFR